MSNRSIWYVDPTSTDDLTVDISANIRTKPPKTKVAEDKPKKQPPKSVTLRPTTSQSIRTSRFKDRIGLASLRQSPVASPPLRKPPNLTALQTQAPLGTSPRPAHLTTPLPVEDFLGTNLAHDFDLRNTDADGIPSVNEQLDEDHFAISGYDDDITSISQLSVGQNDFPTITATPTASPKPQSRQPRQKGSLRSHLLSHQLQNQLQLQRSDGSATTVRETEASIRSSAANQQIQPVSTPFSVSQIDSLMDSASQIFSEAKHGTGMANFRSSLGNRVISPIVRSQQTPMQNIQAWSPTQPSFTKINSSSAAVADRSSLEYQLAARLFKVFASASEDKGNRNVCCCGRHERIYDWQSVYLCVFTP